MDGLSNPCYFCHGMQMDFFPCCQDASKPKVEGKGAAAMLAATSSSGKTETKAPNCGNILQVVF